MSQESPFAVAAKRGIPVTLICNLDRPEGPQHMTLEGYLVFKGTPNWEIKVKNMSILDGQCKHASREAKYSFRIPGDGAGTGVSGVGDILSIKENDEGGISHLLIHFRQPVLRPLRRHPRYTWKKEFTRLATLLAPTRAPARKEQLTDLLREQVSLNPFPPVILDLSAGGGRICVSEEQANTMFSDEQLYVLFFVPSLAHHGEKPFAMLARRLGRCTQTCPTGVAMRFVFLAEMDWEGTGACHWINIASVGSERLKSCLERYKDETFVND